MKFVFAVSAVSYVILSSFFNDVVLGDVYMHNPRGSNNRNCEENENRNNGNRLFDSQNNDKGGYACPLARPFPCYKFLDDTARAECNAKNAVNPTMEMVNENGVVAEDGTRTPRMYYYAGSILPIEWTQQHGCGSNPRMHCSIVIQYACEDTLTDDCGDPTLGKTCGPRDGFPVTNSPNTGNSALNKEATTTIPDNTDNGVQYDYRYGRQETLNFYKRCTRRERNKGLFIADQNLNGNTARFTRQNNNGNRNGLECPEEQEYYPYWHDSPWKDIAYLTSNLKDCETVPFESQNVKAKNECDCPTCTGDIPNSERGCQEKTGTWKVYPAFGIEAPYCGPVDTARENHLGNPVGSTAAGLSSHYNWTIPANNGVANTCFLRLRYNISTIDQDSVSISGDSLNNGFFSPLKDRTNSEEKAYKQFTDVVSETTRTHATVGIAMNTNQYARTFQDRSYSFSIRPAPTQGDCAGKRIFNLNVRGKRGNIVQTYPAVEYDFVPNVLHLSDSDCVHAQWTGSDFNPDRNPNNGYGGPASPLNLNEARADRHNLVQVPVVGVNEPVTTVAAFNMFAIEEAKKMDLIFIGQDVTNPEVCMNITEIKTKYPNLDQNGRDRIHFNCGKLSGALLPYFDAGLLKPSGPGEFHYMSTRDNSFSNRDMKGTIVVSPGISSPAVIGGIVGGLVGLGLIGFAALLFLGKVSLPKRRRSNPLPNSTPIAQPVAQSAPATSLASKAAAPVAIAGAAAAVAKPPAAAALPPPEKVATCVALYAHEASEPGELNFKKGDKITIIRKDDSGWWEGSVGKERGLFPANYVKE